MVTKLGIFIPAYNEAKTIGRVVRDIFSIFKGKDFDVHVVVVNDGSKDETAIEAERAGAKVISHQRNRGLAEAYRTGMRALLEINPDLIIQTDADGQYLAKDMPKLIRPLLKGEADFVLGSRFKGFIEEMPWLKRFGNKAFSRVISSITGLSISDGQTGFRAFTPAVAREIKVYSDHTYTQEVIIRAAERNFKIKEIPIFFARREDGSSRLMSNPLGYARRAFINLFRVYRDHQPLKFFGIFGLISVLAGTVIGAFLLYQYFTQGFITSLAKPILSALFLLFGFQLILFGFMADMNHR